MTIQCRLDELILERGVTAIQISEATGIAESTLSELRTNKAKRIGKSTLNKLCAYFQCSVGELLVYVPDEEGSGGGD